MTASTQNQAILEPHTLSIDSGPYEDGRLILTVHPHRYNEGATMRAVKNDGLFLTEIVSRPMATISSAELFARSWASTRMKQAGFASKAERAGLTLKTSNGTVVCSIGGTFKCLECGRGFHSVRTAERAVSNGCPGCGGVDIDIA